MAETQKGEREDERPPQGANGGEAIPDDPAELKAKIAELERKYGNVLNDAKKAKTAREELTAKLKEWNKLEEEGHTPDEIKALLEQNSAAETAKARERGDLDKLIADARKASEKLAAEERAKRERVEGINQRLLIDDHLNRLLDKYVDPKFKKAVFHMHRGKFKTIEDPEDEYGMRTVVEVGGEYMSGDEYLKNWAENDEEAVPFLKASMASGGGAGGGMVGGKFRTQLYRSQMSAADKSRFIRTHPGGPAVGATEYMKLPYAPEGKTS